MFFANTEKTNLLCSIYHLSQTRLQILTYTACVHEQAQHIIIILTYTACVHEQAQHIIIFLTLLCYITACHVLDAWIKGVDVDYDAEEYSSTAHATLYRPKSNYWEN